MHRTTRILRTIPAVLGLGAVLVVAGCGQEARRAWNGPAGTQIATSDFGNATMNNHLVQTCQAGPNTARGKYVSRIGGCPGRTLDGKYARATYDGYIESAAAEPLATAEE